MNVDLFTSEMRDVILSLQITQSVAWKASNIELIEELEQSKKEINSIIEKLKE